MKRLLIIGAGDLGSLIAYHAKDSGYDVVGFLDDTRKGNVVDGFNVMGGIDEAKERYANAEFDCLMVAIGYKHMSFRTNLYNKLSGSIPFATIIHSSCYIDSSATIGDGCFILPGCVLDHNVQLGENVVLNTACTIAHDSKVGNHSFLSPGVTMAGFIEIGDQCNIGIGTTIIDNLRITDQVQTGGGAVVIKDITESGLYFGVPATKKD